MKHRTHYGFPGVLAVAICIAHTPGAHAQYDDNSCGLFGGLRAPVMLEVHNESTSGGGGPMLWAGTLQRDETVRIHSSAGRIRYNYRYRFNEPWSASVGAHCRNGARITVP